MVNIKKSYRDTAVVIISIICLCAAIGLLIVLYDINNPNPDHTYGESDGGIAVPSVKECDLNGHYYPISSGKCTFNVTYSNVTKISGGVGSSGLIIVNSTPLNMTPTYTCHVTDPYGHGGNKTGWTWGCNNLSEEKNYTPIQVNGVDQIVTLSPEGRVVL